MQDEHDDSEPTYRVHVLRRKQVKVLIQHECVHCTRPICRNEYARVRAVLHIDGKWRAVVADYSCCKELR